MIPPDRILTSPLVRARQTARILAVALGHERAPEETDVLHHSKTPDRVLELLTGLCRSEGAAVVMATHSERCARSCDTVHRLDHGRLLVDTPERVQG